jgi:hypothetical protein
VGTFLSMLHLKYMSLSMLCLKIIKYMLLKEDCRHQSFAENNIMNKFTLGHLKEWVSDFGWCFVRFSKELLTETRKNNIDYMFRVF